MSLFGEKTQRANHYGMDRQRRRTKGKDNSLDVHERQRFVVALEGRSASPQQQQRMNLQLTGSELACYENKHFQCVL